MAHVIIGLLMFLSCCIKTCLYLYKLEYLGIEPDWHLLHRFRSSPGGLPEKLAREYESSRDGIWFSVLVLT